MTTPRTSSQAFDLGLRRELRGGKGEVAARAAAQCLRPLPSGQSRARRRARARSLKFNGRERPLARR